MHIDIPDGVDADRRVTFAIHCIELYRRAHGSDGDAVMDAFIGTGALGYILDDPESFISDVSVRQSMPNQGVGAHPILISFIPA